ncbi:MAG: AbrB/MazE/SpoVT family DNA-binding domain-containing protein [Chloroflexota bacterium]
MDKDSFHGFKCFGSATVGARGQVVIPANARKELDIEAGTTLLVFMGPAGNGLLIFKADAVEQIINIASEQLANVEKLLKNFKKPQASSRISRRK